MLIKYVTTGFCYKSIGALGQIIRSKMENTACRAKSWHSKPSHYRVKSCHGKRRCFSGQGEGQRWTKPAICIQGSSRAQGPQVFWQSIPTIGIPHYPKTVKSIATEGFSCPSSISITLFYSYAISTITKNNPPPHPAQKIHPSIYRNS